MTVRTPQTANGHARGPLHDAWALKVKERAGWACEGCGLARGEIEVLGGELQAAHILDRINYPQMQYDPENGRALCTFKNPHHRHPRGLGDGFGCHNAMSGHWRDGHGPRLGGASRRVNWLVSVVGGTALWGVALVADGHLRYFAALRPFLLGGPAVSGPHAGQNFLHLLCWAAVLLGLWFAAVGGIRTGWCRRVLAGLGAGGSGTVRTVGRTCRYLWRRRAG
jgi:hypothetical protein